MAPESSPLHLSTPSSTVDPYASDIPPEQQVGLLGSTLDFSQGAAQLFAGARPSSTSSAPAPSVDQSIYDPSHPTDVSELDRILGTGMSGADRTESDDLMLSGQRVVTPAGLRPIEPVVLSGLLTASVLPPQPAETTCEGPAASQSYVEIALPELVAGASSSERPQSSTESAGIPMETTMATAPAVEQSTRVETFNLADLLRTPAAVSLTTPGGVTGGQAVGQSPTASAPPVLKPHWPQ